MVNIYTLYIFIFSIIYFFIPQLIFPRMVLIILSSFILLDEIFRKKINLNFKKLLLFFPLLFFSLYHINLHKILILYFFILIFILNSSLKFNLKDISIYKKVVYLCTLSIIFQLFYFKFETTYFNDRSGLGTDPNFSSLIILLLIYFIFPINKLLPILLAIVTLYFTQSRSFFIAIIILLIFNYYKKNIKFQCFFKIRNFIYVIFFLNLFISLYSIFSYSNTNFKKNESKNFIERISVFNDNSNKGRLYANIYWLDKVLGSNYIFNSFESEEKIKTNKILLPHNSFIYLLISQSLFYSIFFLFFLNFIFKKLININNFHIFYSYIIFSLFLHGLFSPIFLFPFLISLILNNKLAIENITN